MIILSYYFIEEKIIMYSLAIYGLKWAAGGFVAGLGAAKIGRIIITSLVAPFGLILGIILKEDKLVKESLNAPFEAVFSISKKELTYAAAGAIGGAALGVGGKLALSGGVVMLNSFNNYVAGSTIELAGEEATGQIVAHAGRNCL